MRVLANENFPREAVEALRSQGHDVAWIREDAPGCTDRQVMERARAEARLIVTFDKDFGELAFRGGLQSPCGVVLFRIALRTPAHVARVAATTLTTRDDWHGHFAVIEDSRIRMTPLPHTES